MKTRLRVPLALAVTTCLIAAAGRYGAGQAGTPASGRTAAAAGQLPGVDPGFLSALEWRFVGPPRGGRSVAVVGDPIDPLVFYFGSSHGGGWKSTDAGGRWGSLSGGYVKTSPGGALDGSWSNPAIV